MITEGDRNVLPIGSSVRVRIAIDVTGPKRRGDDVALTVARRSIVATLPDDDGRVSLVQDDLAPVPLTPEGRFLIAPMFKGVGFQFDECEADASDLLPLLAFENQRDRGDDIADFKDYGDQLLRLNDYTCAISYYEAALNLVSTKIEVGGTVIVRRKGHFVIAEVDFIENDEEGNMLYDVTFPSGENDATISQKEIIFAVWTKDVLNLQTKILLNLSRCLLKLADVDVSWGNSNLSGETMSMAKSGRQDKYRQATVLGCSIAISICDHLASECIDEVAAELNSLRDKARIVRSRAFLALSAGQLPNAIVDVKKVLIRNTTNREAKVLLSEIKAAKAFVKLADKRLSKEFFRWVKTAIDTSNGAEALGRVDGLASDDVQSGDVARDRGRNDNKMTQMNSFDRWRIVTNISMEIFALALLLLSVFVIYRNDPQQSS